MPLRLLFRQQPRLLRCVVVVVLLILPWCNPLCFLTLLDWLGYSSYTMTFWCPSQYTMCRVENEKLIPGMNAVQLDRKVTFISVYILTTVLVVYLLCFDLVLDILQWLWSKGWSKNWHDAKYDITPVTFSFRDVLCSWSTFHCPQWKRLSDALSVSLHTIFTSVPYNMHYHSS